MKRCHFAVITHLGNANTYPVLPLCTELVKRGHRVSYVTNNHYARVVAETGSEPVLINDEPMPKNVEEQVLRLDLPFDAPGATEANLTVQRFFLAQALQMISQVEPFYRNNPPDLILYDRYHAAGRILAVRLNIPTVQLSPTFAFYKNLSYRQNGMCGNPDLVYEWSKDLDAFLAAHGVTTQDNYWHVEDLNIHFIPKEFQYHSDYFDDRFCFVGALLNRPFKRVWTNRSNGKPLILISGLSSLQGVRLDLRSYFKTFVEALSGMDCHCILSVAGSEPPGGLPDNFEINRDASHLEILPHVDLAITHGGQATTLEALYSGVPTLMIPQNPACEEVAYRTQELGLGVQIRKEDLTIQNVQHTARAMMEDTSLCKRVRDMQQKWQQSGGAGLGADRLEARLGG